MAKFLKARSRYLINKSGVYFLALVFSGTAFYLLNSVLSPYFPEEGILKSLLSLFVITLCICAINEGLRWRNRANNYLDGDDGEYLVGKILKELPNEYIVIPDIKKPQGGNIDFVVVGPTRVFALEIKNPQKHYNIDIRGKKLTFNGKIDKGNSLAQTIGNAAILGNQLKSALNNPYLFVIPVLVFANHQNILFDTHLDTRGPHVINSDLLPKLLAHQGNRVVSTKEVQRIAEKIKTAFQSQ